MEQQITSDETWVNLTADRHRQIILMNPLLSKP